MKPRICFLKKKPSPRVKLGKTKFSFALSHSTLHFTLQRSNTSHAHFSLNASSASGFIVEPASKVAFQTALNLPGCSNSLSLLGTGFREKVFENVGVKVYAVCFYVNPSVSSTLQLSKGRSAAEILEDSSIFSSIFEEKSLQIVLVRDLDGATFCYTLYDAISPRIKFTT